MISAKAAYWLGVYQSLYFDAISFEEEYFGGSKSEEDFDIAMAIIPHVLSDTETRMNIRIHNPAHGIGTYANLDTMHPDDAEAYIEEIKAFFKEIRYSDDTVVRLVPELSHTIPS